MKKRTLRDYVTGTQSGPTVFRRVNTVPMEKKGKINAKPKTVKVIKRKRKTTIF